MVADDLVWLRRCVELARKGEGFVSSNPMVGACLVRGGRVISEGWHERFGGAHAEVNCLNQDGRDEIDGQDILYVSLEPCCFEGKTGACTDVILKSGVRRVVVGMVDPDERSRGKGISLLRESGVYVEVLQAEQRMINDQLSMINEFSVCNDPRKKLLSDLIWMNRGFICRIEKKRPWVTVKCAVSRDGYVAPLRPPQSPRSGDSSPLKGGALLSASPFWITDEEARAHVHAERGKYDAIVVGSGTVVSDDPQLTTHGLGKYQPWRVVLGLPNVECRLLNDAFKERTIAVSNQQRVGGSEFFDVWEMDSYDIEWLLRKGFDEGWSKVYVEGGPRVWRSFLNSGLVDQIDWYESPDELRGGVRCGIGELDLRGFEVKEEKMFGEDVLKRYVHSDLCHL